jgi:hypothetical protein
LQVIDDGLIFLKEGTAAWHRIGTISRPFGVVTTQDTSTFLHSIDEDPKFGKAVIAPWV